MNSTPQNPSPSAEARVLLVDDDRELCQMLTEYLNAEHFEVRSVHDGAQALTEVRSKGYEIVILDVMLPSVSGFDVLREIAALTGGKFAAPGDLAQIISSLSLLPERKPEELRFRLWCDPWWCGALLTLFSAYWIGRKIGGLV